MGEVLGRLVRIGPGEGRLAAALFAVMLLTSVGAGAGATAADALLFARYGVDALPQLYLALGLASFVCALGLSVVFGAVRRDRVYPVALLTLVAVLLGLRVAVARPADLAYPAMWLGANVVVMVQGIVGWGVASWLCDARQAKRLFPLANAAKILGVIVGSAAVAPLVLVFRLDDLLVLWALVLVLTFALVARLGRTAPAAPARERTVSLAAELLAGLRVVRASPLLRSLAVALVLFSVLFFGLALPFTRAARATMPQEDDLASFLGLFSATTTGAAFLASLLVANRFYARFGVVNAILAFTLVYLGAFAVLALTDSFVAVAAVRWIQLAWLAGIADAAYQALFNPVPAERRDQMRAFMEGVPGQAGIAIAGVLLLVGDQAPDPRSVALGGVVVAAATTAVIWRARGAYREALVAALRAGRPEPFVGAEEGYASLRADRAAIRIATGGLASVDLATRRASAQILSELAPPNIAADLVRAASDEDALVRAAALRGGALVAPLAFVEAARASVADPSARVRTAALLVLQRAGDREAADRLRAHAGDADGGVRGAAAIALAASDMADAADLLASLAHDGDPAVRRAAVEGLALRDPARAVAVAEPGLDDPREAGRALDILEALPGARASARLRAFAARERDAALRNAALASTVGADGDVAEIVRLSLRRRAASAARLAVRAAAVLSGRSAPAALLDGLESSHARTRAEALETLESYVAPDLARRLLPIWEGEPAPTSGSLADHEDPWIRDCAAYLDRDGGDVMATLTTLPLMERVLFLHKVPLFAALDPSDLQQIARIAAERAFADGESVFRQGDRGEAMYVIVEGALRVEQDGRAIATRRRGDVMGEMAIVIDQPRMATVVAEGDTRTLRIARAEFESILRDRPETALGVIRVLSVRLAEATAAR